MIHQYREIVYRIILGHFSFDKKSRSTNLIARQAMSRALTPYRLVGMLPSNLPELIPMPPMPLQQPHDSKIKLLDAALLLIRTKGYAGTTVDDICRQAGITKGSFFHHFKGKDDLALAAVAYWGEKTEAMFAAAPYHQAPDPLDRILGYLDFRQALLQGDAPQYTCLLGTLVQETYITHPAILAACDGGLSRHVAELTHDLALAKASYAPQATWSVESLGYFMQSVLQGAFIFSKAHQSPDVARASIEHLRRYLKTLFAQ